MMLYISSVSTQSEQYKLIITLNNVVSKITFTKDRAHYGQCLKTVNEISVHIPYCVQLCGEARVLCFACALIYIHTLYMLAAKTLSSLHIICFVFC